MVGNSFVSPNILSFFQIIMNPHAQSFCHPRRAFTLVEMLIIIVIIIALAAVIFPMARSIRQAAGTAKTVQNLRQIQAANVIIAGDNGGFFVGNAPFGEGTDFWGAKTFFTYLPFVSILGANSAGEGDDGKSLPDAWGKNYPEVLKCGMEIPSPINKRSFSIAMNMSKWSHAQGGTPFGESPNGAWTPGKILQARIKKPDKLIMFYESACYWSDFYQRLDWKKDDGGWYRGMAFRNKGRTCNVVFADGHVGSLTRKDVEKDNVQTRRYFYWDAD